MEDREDAFLEIHLEGTDSALVFESAEQLVEWLTSEQQSWRELLEQNARNPSPHHPAALDLTIRKLQDLINIARRIKDPAANRNEYERVRDGLAELYNVIGLPFSSSSAFQFLQRCRGLGIGVAVGALFVLLKKIPGAFHTPRIDEVIGVLRGQLFAGGFLREGFDRQALDELCSAYEERLTRLDATAAQMREKATEAERAFSSLLTTSKKQLQETLDEFHQLLEEKEKFFEEKLALQAPVDYWEEKAKQHKITKWVQFTCGVLLSTGFMVGLVVLLVSPPSVLLTDTGHPPFWVMFALVSIGAMAIWVIRLLFKLFLSNQHLESAALEKAVMLQTYLALLEKDKIDEKDRLLVLQSVFRPSVTGVVKEDGPPGLLGAIERFLLHR